MYYTNEDFERFYLRYKTEGLRAKESMQSFCSRNKVPFNLFLKWYKDTRVRLVSVQIDGKPNKEAAPTVTENQPGGECKPTAEYRASRIITAVDIKVSNGLSVHQENVSLDELKRLVTNLEALW